MLSYSLTLYSLERQAVGTFSFDFPKRTFSFVTCFMQLMKGVALYCLGQIG